MAAATVLIQALPPNRKIIMYVDSMATIQALESLGPTSERRRIKAQGRAWKNFLRTTWKLKEDQIHIAHVRSHQGRETSQQQGNDLADQLAKQFMKLHQV